MASITKEYLLRLLKPKEDPGHAPGLESVQRSGSGSTLIFRNELLGAYFALDYSVVRTPDGSLEIKAETYHEDGVERIAIRQVQKKEFTVVKWVPVGD